MKHFYLGFLIASTALMAGCSADEPAAGGLSGQAKIAVRSSGDNVFDGQPVRLTVIGDNGGVVLDCKSASEIPPSVTLLGGDYTAVATVGDSVPASFDKRYFKGMTRFKVSHATPADVAVDCKIANVAVKVDIDPSVDNALHDYAVTVGHSAGKLTFTGRDSRSAYFMMPSLDETILEYELTGVTDTGTPFSKKGVIRDVCPATCYTLTISFQGKIDPAGGLPILLDVDTSVTEIEFEDEIQAPPVVEGIGVSLSEPIKIEEGAAESDVIVGIASTVGLKSLTAGSRAFTSAGLPDETVDFVGIDPDISAAFLKKGIKGVVKTGPDGGADAAINLSRFFQRILPPGETQVTITATDVNGQATTCIVTFEVAAAAR